MFIRRTIDTVRLLITVLDGSTVSPRSFSSYPRISRPLLQTGSSVVPSMVPVKTRTKADPLRSRDVHGMGALGSVVPSPLVFLLRWIRGECSQRAALLCLRARILVPASPDPRWAPVPIPLLTRLISDLLSPRSVRRLLLHLGNDRELPSYVRRGIIPRVSKEHRACQLLRCSEDASRANGADGNTEVLIVR